MANPAPCGLPRPCGARSRRAGGTQPTIEPTVRTKPLKPFPDETRLQVMRLLAENPELTQRELAEALGISLGATNFCLRALIDKGLVKAENFRKSHRKRAYLYKLTPTGIAEKMRVTRAFLARKQAEYRAIEQEIEALRRELQEEGGG